MKLIALTFVLLLGICESKTIHYDLGDEVDNLRNATLTLITDLQEDVGFFIEEIKAVETKTMDTIIQSMTSILYRSEEEINTAIKEFINEINELEYAANKEYITVGQCVLLKPQIQQLGDMTLQQIKVSFNTIIYSVNKTIDNEMETMNNINARVNQLPIMLENCGSDSICIIKIAQIAIQYSTDLIDEMKVIVGSIDDMSHDTVIEASDSVRNITYLPAKLISSTVGIVTDCINIRMSFVTPTTPATSTDTTTYSTTPTWWETTRPETTTYPTTPTWWETTRPETTTYPTTPTWWETTRPETTTYPTTSTWWDSTTSTYRPTSTYPTTSTWWDSTTSTYRPTSTYPTTSTWWDITTSTYRPTSTYPTTFTWWDITTSTYRPTSTYPTTSTWWDSTTSTYRPTSTYPTTFTWWDITTSTYRPTSTYPTTSTWWDSTTSTYRPTSTYPTTFTWWDIITSTYRPTSTYPTTSTWWDSTTSTYPETTTKTPSTSKTTTCSWSNINC